MMKSTEIVLVRHGQTEWNLEGRRQGYLDSPLTELGLFQAKRIAERLSEQSYAAVYSSDLGRAFETARAISSRTGNEISMDRRLRERSYGIFEGLTRVEIEKTYPEEFSMFRTGGPDYAIPRGESISGFCSRCISCLEELAQLHEGESIVIVTHLGVLNCAFRHMLGIPLEIRKRFEVLEGSFNLAQYQSGKWLLRTWGDISHLDQDGGKGIRLNHKNS